MPVSDEDDLAEKLKRKESCIEIEGDLAAKVIRIKATGTVAWALVLGAVVVALRSKFMAATPSIDPVTKGLVPVVGIAGSSGTVAAILGIGGAATAAKLVKSAGGVSILNDLRSYKVVSKSEGRVVLSRE